MRILISFFLILFSYSPVLALSTDDADEFGDNFITAIQAGESMNFIPNQFHLETFLYSAFGKDYLKLTSEEKKQAQTSLANSLKILHSSPMLVNGYRQMSFINTNLQEVKVNNDYIYSFISQLPGDNSREGAIYLKEINGEIWIVDIKTSYWLTKFTGQMYQDMKQEVSIPQLMKMMEYKYREQFGSQQ